MIKGLINTGNGAPANEGRETTKLLYTQIRTNGGTQMRTGVNEVTAGEYADEIRRGVEFPPVIVFYDGETYWLGDGFHRVRAYFMAGGHTAEIPAEVRPGTRRDAVLWAAGANASHGLRRTRQDKERAVDALLADDEWGQWADREIARRCNVSHTFVAARRKLHTGNTASMNGDAPTERTFIHPKTGQLATMNVAGQRQAAQNRLNVKETEAIIWQVLEQETNKEPADMLAWLNSEQGNAIPTYERPAAVVIGAGEFWAAERLVRNRLTEMVAADESRAAEAERWGDPGDDDPPTRQLTPDETEAVIWRVIQKDGGESLDEQEAEVRKRTKIEDYAHALNPGVEFNDREFGLALLRVRKQLADKLVRRWAAGKASSPHDDTAHAKRQRAIQAEIEFWAGAQRRVNQIGELTGRWTGPALALGRAIGDVLKLLQENVTE